MKYDVFISYSRKDTAVADRICAAFDKASISYFIDRQNIYGGMDFPQMLAEAIEDSEIVLFLASRNSYLSKFSNSEIIYAFNEKKKIIPYCIDRAAMPRGLRLVFGSVNRRTLHEHPVETRLVEDVLGLLERPRIPETVSSDSSSPVLPSVSRLLGFWRRLSASGRSVGMYVLVAMIFLVFGFFRLLGGSDFSDAAKTYAVGDYYCEKGRTGVVFEVDASGCHGKIVGMAEARLGWCTKELYDRKERTETLDKTDGRNNMKVIEQIAGWENKYPAFAWCAAQGDGWYLPAIDELKKFMLDDVLRDAVNRKLAQYDGICLLDKNYKESDSWYWSSSEYNESLAWSFHSGIANSTGGAYKFGVYRVRAIAVF